MEMETNMHDDKGGTRGSPGRLVSEVGKTPQRVLLGSERSLTEGGEAAAPPRKNRWAHLEWDQIGTNRHR